MSRLDELLRELCPGGVKYQCLSDIAVVTSGNSAPQNKAYFENGMYPFVRTSDVGKYHITDNLIKVEDYLNDTGIKGLRLFPKGSILFPKSGASTLVNHRAMLGCDSYVVSHLAVIIPTSINNKFLYYYLTTIDARELVEDLSYPSLKTSTIATIKVPVPPQEVQLEIVRLLDGLFESYSQLINELRYELTMRKAQYREYSRVLFDGMDCVKRTTLGEIVDIQMCKRIKKDQTTTQGDVPFYQNGTLGGVAKLYISDALFEEFSRKYKYPKQGEVMLSTVGTVGKTIQFDGEKAYFQDSNIVWLHRKTDDVTDEYLYWFCISMPWKLPDRATLKHLHNYMIADTEIAIPSLESQTSIVSQFKRLRAGFESIYRAIQQEIDARQKQYEYYRDKLLTFKEIS